MSIFRAFFTVSFYTMLSRIMGFIRDILMAAILGVSGLAEVFLIAFKLPNLFRRVFAEGAFSSVFVPLYTHKLEDEGQEPATRFARQMLGWLVSVLVILTLLAELLMAYIIPLFAPGFVGDDAKLSQAITLSRITFPYLLCLSIVAFYGGLLSTKHRFAAQASAPILLNLCLIAALLSWEIFFDNPAISLAYGVLIAGILQCAWLLIAAKRQRCLITPLPPTRNSDTSLFIKRIIPGIIGAGVTQLNVWIDVIIATFLPSAIAFLYYADRINQLPLAVVGTAMGTALLPSLSRYLKKNERDEAIHIQQRAMVCAAFFALPASVAICILALPIISVLFERGAFNHQASLATAYALMGYAAGLPAIILSKITSSAFFALGDTKTPVSIAMRSLAINLILNLTFVYSFPLMGWMPHVGLAIATSIAAWCNVIMLQKKLVRLHNLPVHYSHIKPELLKITSACSIMALCLLGLQWAMPHIVPEEFHSTTAITPLVLYISLGLISYFLTAYLVGILNLRKILGKT